MSPSLAVWVTCSRVWWLERENYVKIPSWDPNCVPISPHIPTDASHVLTGTCGGAATKTSEKPNSRSHSDIVIILTRIVEKLGFCSTCFVYTTASSELHWRSESVRASSLVCEVRVERGRCSHVAAPL